MVRPPFFKVEINHRQLDVRFHCFNWEPIGPSDRTDQRDDRIPLTAKIRGIKSAAPAATDETMVGYQSDPVLVEINGKRSAGWQRTDHHIICERRSKGTMARYGSKRLNRLEMAPAVDPAGKNTLLDRINLQQKVAYDAARRWLV